MTTEAEDPQPPVRTFAHATGESPPTGPPAFDEDTSTFTALDELREELADEIVEPITIRVPGRPKWGVRFNPDIEGPVLGRWAKRAKDKTQAGELDTLKLACTTLASQCVAIVKVDDAWSPGMPFIERVEHETDVVDDDGETLRFTSPALHAMLGVGRPIDAVPAFYSLDGYVMSVWLELIEAAGYGDEVPDGDPTKRP